MLTTATIDAAITLRHHLHRHPELSKLEHKTADFMAKRLASLSPEKLVTGLGGTGVAAVFGKGAGGLIIRCELDALPIQEVGNLSYKSQTDGVGHLCGHDGHMAILFAVAQHLAEHPPSCRVILLFQPAEETGDGARDILADPRFTELDAVMAIALHNLPKMPLGSVLLEEGPVTCASRGLRIMLTGRTSHSSAPENGRSPAEALSKLIPALHGLAVHTPPSDPAFRLTTITHARLGVPNFGVSPGDAELYVTLRTRLNDELEALEAEARRLVAQHAGEFAPCIEVLEPFSHGVNHPDATDILRRATSHLSEEQRPLPMRFSEDFGLFGTEMPAALLFLGSGEDQPELHNPDFDFPDALIPIGAEIFLRAIEAFASERP